MLAPPHCIIAYTAEDDRYAALRLTAEVAARNAGATLILYDIDAAGMFAAPLPTVEWSAGLNSTSGQNLRESSFDQPRSGPGHSLQAASAVTSGDNRMTEDELDRVIDDSFPASDPPSYTPAVGVGPAAAMAEDAGSGQ